MYFDLYSVIQAVTSKQVEIERQRRHFKNMKFWVWVAAGMAKTREREAATGGSCPLPPHWRHPFSAFAIELSSRLHCIAHML